MNLILRSVAQRRVSKDGTRASPFETPAFATLRRAPQGEAAPA
jgi:hypothetical protein